MILSILAFLSGANAFSKSSLARTPATTNNLLANGARHVRNHRDFSLSNEKLLVEPIDPREDLPVSNIPGAHQRYMSTLSNDQLISEELLESITNTKPEDVFAGVDIDFVEHVSSIFSDSPAELQPPSFEQSPNNNVLSGVEFADFSNATLSEDVLAVLAVLEASEEAAAAAEASMLEEIREQLELPPNSTVLSTPMEVDSIPEILSAASVVGEPVTATKIDSPPVSQILKFAIPAIGVWLCGPLLSLIDTSAVGLLAGTTHQAALNPAVAVTDYAALLIAFMYTGTTNLVAAAQEKDRTNPDRPVTTKTMIGAMKLSTYVGGGLGVFLFAFARPLLKAIIGNDSISPAVFAAAMKYVRIRALGMPAAAIIGSTQSACLGMKDIRSPLYVLFAAAVVNFFGDMLFVGNAHPMIGGTAGAAWATVFSQYAGVALFVRWLCNKPTTKPKVVNVSKAIIELTGKPTSEGGSRRQQLRDTMQSFTLNSVVKKSRKNTIGKLGKLFKPKKVASGVTTKKEEEQVSARGFLQNKFSFADLVKPPSKHIREEFKPYLVPVTSTQIGRVSGYVAMSHVVASSLGTASMAAQQVIVSLFYCLCPIADSLSLTAQSFVPAISERIASKEKAAALRRTAINFIKAGAVFGGAMVAAVSAIPLLSGFFTSDPVVVSMVNSVVPLLLAFFGVHGVLCAAEGLLLGQKDLSFLGKMYGGYFFVLPYLMMRVKRAALAGSSQVSLNSVWQVFLGYQMFRLGAWISRVVMLQRRTEVEGNNAEFSI